jgi:hypothetical protein
VQLSQVRRTHALEVVPIAADDGRQPLGAAPPFRSGSVPFGRHLDPREDVV